VGRAPLLAALALASVSIDGIRAEDAAAVPPVAVRMVKLAGELADPRVRDHVAFCRDAGFNALWVYSWEAGAWDATRAPKRPIVDPEFQTAARTWSREGLDPWVSINPVADGPAPFVFSDPAGEDRIVAFAALLRKRAGIRHLVLSFDDQPTELTEFADILRYGKSAAPAHLDLVRRIAARLPGHTEPTDALQESGILIDGEVVEGSTPKLLLQIFSKTVIGPIFFEFIERKGDEGFGEGNFKALFESIEADQIARGVLEG